MDQWIHPNSRGGVPSGECRDLTLDTGLDIEEAHLDPSPFWGIDEEVKKCYDSLVRKPLFELLDAQERFYDQFYRAFKYGQSLGEWFKTAYCSILQGCALGQQ